MRNKLKTLTLAFITATILYACKKDNNYPNIETPPASEKESKYIRVLIADEISSKLNLIDPFSESTSVFDAKYPMANLYGTASGRYATVLYQSQNLVEVFDSGLSLHTDHVDVVNDPKWASITSNGLKPSHFKSRGTESLIFNDNDGTLSVGYDEDFNKPGAKFSVINAGILPHHGAMAQFNNGTVAELSHGSVMR